MTLALELFLMVLPAITVEVMVEAIIAIATRIFVRQDAVAEGEVGAVAGTRIQRVGRGRASTLSL